MTYLVSRTTACTPSTLYGPVHLGYVYARFVLRECPVIFAAQIDSKARKPNYLIQIEVFRIGFFSLKLAELIETFETCISIKFIVF